MQTLLEALGEDRYNKALSDSVINIADGQALAWIMRQDTVKQAFLGASISIATASASRISLKSISEPRESRSRR